MPFPQFDRSRLKLKPLSERVHDLTIDSFYRLDDPIPPFDHPALDVIAERIVRARRDGAPVLMLMGAHVIRAGVSRFLIDLMERVILTHIAMNGAGPIHDFELALIGATTESVARYIRRAIRLVGRNGIAERSHQARLRTGFGHGRSNRQVHF